MANQANIKAIITAEDRASSVLSGFGSSVNKLGRDLALGLAAASAASVAFGIESVKAFTESEDAQAQLNAVLKSTAGVAGVTAKSATDLATSLQKVTKFSDETVLGGENLLLTFTAIGKDIFPQATKVMLDMSQALGQDVKSSAIQLGKALQDPILGVTALRRVGVNFSDKQQEVIKKLVDTGKAAEAQKLILKELQTEFGGSAEAAGTTFAGKLAILKNQLNDVQESLGQAILKGIIPFTTKAAEFVNKVDWSSVINKTLDSLSNLWHNYLVPFSNAVRDVADQIGNYLEPKFIALKNSVQDAMPTFKQLWDEVLQPLSVAIGTTIVIAIGLMIDAVNLLISVLQPLIQWMLQNKTTVEALAASFGILAFTMNFNLIVAAFNTAINSVIITLNILRFVTLPGLAATLGTTAAGFGGLASAAIIAAAVIIDAGNRTKAAWDQTNAAIVNAGNSNDEAIRKIQAAIKSGTISKEKGVEMIRSQTTTRALGGPVTAGRSYMVGERGKAEMFVPNQNGRIINDQELAKLATVPQNMTAPTTYNITVQAGALMGNDVEARKFAQTILNHMKGIAASKNTTLQEMMG